MKSHICVISNSGSSLRGPGEADACKQKGSPTPVAWDFFWRKGGKSDACWNRKEKSLTWKGILGLDRITLVYLVLVKIISHTEIIKLGKL